MKISPVYYLYSFRLDKIYTYWFSNEIPASFPHPDIGSDFQSFAQIYIDNPNLFVCFNEPLIHMTDFSIFTRNRGVYDIPIIASKTLDKTQLAIFLSYCKSEKLSQFCIKGVCDFFIIKIPDLPEPLFLFISYESAYYAALYNSFEDAMYRYRTYLPLWPNHVYILNEDEYIWDESIWVEWDEE